MATKNQIFPKPHIVALDLQGKQFAVTIDHFGFQEVNDPKGGDKKTKAPVLWFKDAKKYLILNSTNWDAVVDATGKENSDEWGGHKIVLFPTTKVAFGKTWNVIRVAKPIAGAKAEALPELAMPEADEDPEPLDEIA